jgi:hypothetical protein
MKTDIPFLGIEDAQDMQSSIENLDIKLSQIDEKLTRIMNLFNPQIDGERGIMVRMANLEANQEFFRKFIYAGFGIYGFIIFCFTVYNSAK